ncbi:hypothetical protein LT493_04760 [Streptomyces tricolor]|nr:hypothetical protein [Streptomyces tricolor]
MTGTVPRELVHKHAPHEVLLTDWTTHGRDRHTVRARWPRFHTFYASRNRRFDPLLFVETVRQTFPLLSHTAYGVPFRQPSGLGRLQASRSSRRACWSRPARPMSCWTSRAGTCG